MKIVNPCFFGLVILSTVQNFQKPFVYAETMNPLEHVVHFSPACTGIYLGSPSIVRTPNGDLLVSMDMFGPGAPRSEGTKQYNTALIFRSCDDGDTWRYVTCVQNTFWASLFVHRGKVYYLGCSEAYGSIVIRRSDDNGTTWTEPDDEHSGLLFKAGPGNTGPNFHCAPMPVVEHEGRLYRAFENCTPREWPSGFRSLVISAEADIDLLKSSSWIMSNQVVYDQESDPAQFTVGANHLPGGNSAGWLEGNVVPAPDGQLHNILRVNSLPVVDRAAVLLIENSGEKLNFNPSIFVFPVGSFSSFISVIETLLLIWTFPLIGFFFSTCTFSKLKPTIGMIIYVI